MRFSILVPVYNVEKYIEQCVESLLGQTCNADFEIILVDDGSTDSSGKICDSYACSHPSIIKVIHKKNEGLVSARDAGIANASGEICIFVDSDDFVEPNLIETVDSCFKRHSDADTVIYSFNYFRNNIKSPKKDVLTQAETVFTKESKSTVYDALINTSLVTAMWIKAVRTDILRKDSTDYSLFYSKNMAEDMFRSIPILTLSQKIVYINAHLYNYRTNDESISRSFKAETIPKKNTLYVYDKIKEYLPVWDMDNEKYRSKLNSRWFNEAMYTFFLYYENVIPAERKSVLEYDWCSMVPEETVNKTFANESKPYRKIFELLKAKRYFSVRFFFFKKKLSAKIKMLKSKVFG